MKRKIRTNVFESASSSVHTLSISSDGREESRLPVDEDGYIVCELKYYFGKNYKVYSEQIEKLAYLVTCCYYLNHCSLDDIHSNYEFQLIEEAVCEYAGAKGIKETVPKDYDEEDVDHWWDFGMDHQSQPYDGIEIINIYDENSIIDFVFNKYVTLTTSCD